MNNTQNSIQNHTFKVPERDMTMPDANNLTSMSQMNLADDSSMMYSEDTLHPGDKSNMTFRTKAIRGMERQGLTNVVFDLKEKEMNQKLDEWSLVDNDIK